MSSLFFIICYVCVGSALWAQFAGGAGKGDAKNGTSAHVMSHRKLWTGRINTDWNNPQNWFPIGVPFPVDSIAIEQNNNSNFPVLDQSRSLVSVDFNQAQKKIILGPYDFTVQRPFLSPGDVDYVQTNGNGKLKTFIFSLQTFLFPTGKSTYNPVSISNQTGSADDFSVQVFDAVYEQVYSGPVIATPHVQRTWNIGKSQPNSGNGVDFVFYWKNTEESMPLAIPKMHHHDGNIWQPSVPSSFYSQLNGNPHSLSVVGYTGVFSPFFVNQPDDPLPVSLLHFSISCDQQRPQVKWITATEINNERFEVECSLDGINWEKVYETPGNGNSNSPITYTASLPILADEKPLFLRLIQIDFNSERQVLATQQVQECNTAQITLFPNPSIDMAWLTGAPPNSNWTIWNAAGTQLGAWHADTDGRILLHQGLPPGIYYVRGFAEKECITLKMVVL
jgi:hypothetical protein